MKPLKRGGQVICYTVDLVVTCLLKFTILLPKQGQKLRNYCLDLDQSQHVEVLFLCLFAFYTQSPQPDESDGVNHKGPKQDDLAKELQQEFPV